MLARPQLLQTQVLPSLRPSRSEHTATTEGSLPHSRPSPLLFPDPIPSATTAPCNSAEMGNCARLKGPTPAAERPRRGQGGSGTVPRHGHHPATGRRLADPPARAAGRSLGGQPEEFCSPERDLRKLFKIQPKINQRD